MAVVGWTDSGMDWTIDRTGYATESAYYIALVNAFYERSQLWYYAGGNVNPIVVPPKTLDPSYFVIGAFSIPYYIRFFWFVSETSIWVNRSSVDYAKYAGGYAYDDVVPTLWTRTAMRSYLETNYGYGDIWDLFQDTSANWRGYEMSWRHIHCLYIILNLLTVAKSSLVANATTLSTGTAWRTAFDTTWATAQSTFNASALQYQFGREYAYHTARYDSSAGRYYITRLCANMRISRSSDDASHNIRKSIIAKALSEPAADAWTYCNNDYPAIEFHNAWQIYDTTDNKYGYAGMILESLVSANSTVDEPTGGSGTGIQAWYVQLDNTEKAFALIDGLVSGGFTYQDDTI